jgi:hypothetical protein
MRAQGAPAARRMRAAALAALLCAAACACASAFQPPSDDWQLQMGAPVSPAEAAELREEVREMVRRILAASRAALSANGKRSVVAQTTTLTRTRARLRAPLLPQFTFTYDSYMRHAFPRDELRPISCTGHVRSLRQHCRRPPRARACAFTPLTRALCAARRTRWAGTR